MTRFDSATPEPPPWRAVELTLDKLCEQAGVTVRTVRYYIAEGLLPPPIGSGTSARYSGEHLDRLAAIAALKDRFLPLREIRRTLGAMDPAEIMRLAATHREAAGNNAPGVASAPMAYAPQPFEEPDHPDTDPADYIAHLLQQPPTAAPLRRSATPLPTPESPTTWVRVRISDDAELMIETASYQRHEEQIAALVTWAQRILK